MLNGVPSTIAEKVVAVQSLSRFRLFVTPRTAAHQASLSFTISWSLLKLMSIEWMMPSNLLILCCPLLLPSIFLSIRVYSNKLALPIRWLKYWSFSFSISPSNDYSGLIYFTTDWFNLLGRVKGLSRVFSSTTVRKHQFFLALSLLYGSALTSLCDYWKSHSSDYTVLCQQSYVSAL